MPASPDAVRYRPTPVSVYEMTKCRYDFYYTSMHTYFRIEILCLHTATYRFLLEYLAALYISAC